MDKAAARTALVLLGCTQARSSSWPAPVASPPLWMRGVLPSLSHLLFSRRPPLARSRVAAGPPPPCHDCVASPKASLSQKYWLMLTAGGPCQGLWSERPVRGVIDPLCGRSTDRVIQLPTPAFGLGKCSSLIGGASSPYVPDSSVCSKVSQSAHSHLGTGAPVR